jgi:hypothetical protein
MADFVKVSMNLHPVTIKKVDSLGAHLNEPNRTRVVSTSISLASEIVDLIKLGNKIIVKDKEGNEQEYKFFLGN